MKILIVNDKLISGGAEIYANNLKNILEEQGNEVYYMFFKGENIYTDDKSYIKLECKRGERFNKIVNNPFLYKKITECIESISPDIIILNNIFTAPITILKAIKGIVTYQIVHDYSIVCCNGECIKKDKSICRGYKYEDCTQCNHFASKFKMSIKNKNHRRVEKLRKKYIRLHISPSQKLYKYLLEYGYKSKCVNNPIYLKKESKYKVDLSRDLKDFLYIGSINERKGIFQFIEAFNIFSKEKNVKLKIIGEADSEENSQKLNKLIKENKKIEMLGYVNNEKVRDELEEAFCLVVPSVWMENYPTVVLEGMASKTLIMASNRGGIPEILGENRGLLFNVLDMNNIISTLEKVFNTDEKEYKDITDKAMEYLIRNNSYKIYSEKIKSILSS